MDSVHSLDITVPGDRLRARRTDGSQLLSAIEFAIPQ